MLVVAVHACLAIWYLGVSDLTTLFEENPFCVVRLDRPMSAGLESANAAHERYS